MFIPRLLDLEAITAARSCFLFGPRQTGKSSLIRRTLPPETPVYNLPDHGTWLALGANPGRMREELLARNPRNPLVEEHGFRFLLTGSSARKLRRSGVNLLGGRARSRRLHPFSWKELGEGFDLLKALDRGLLPFVYGSEEPAEDLRSHVGAYLREEIAAEGLTRNVPAFARFLEVAAACSGKMINKTEVANDAKVPRTTVHEYFEILRDTLIGYELPAWTRSRKRKAIETAKFYLFDGGVSRAIQGLPALQAKSADFGNAFEHFLLHELQTYVDTKAPGTPLAYWRSTSNVEVDFILGDHTAVEVKATASVSKRDLRGLEALGEEGLMKRLLLVCQEKAPRKIGEVLVLPWAEFLEQLRGRAFAE